MYTYEEALEDARFFEKNVNICKEYDDAWVFLNNRKKRSPYNPVVIYKADGDAVPYSVYKPSGAMRMFDIPKKKRR